jgi:parallel beta-helix repeat protein
MRRFHFVLLAFTIVLFVQPLVAGTYYVGTCKIGAYGTIGAAVAAVPSGSTIDVCPGTYPEQVTISQSLTLQVYFSGNSSQAIITVPSGGLATTSSLFFNTVAAQVEVTAGTVTITGITVDGTASGSNCPSIPYTGIFYSANSSGKVEDVETRYQNCSGTAGVGILAENNSSATSSLTIENSSVHDNTGWGVIAWGGDLTATIKDNYVASAGNAIESASVGSISGNSVAGAYYGIYQEIGGATITSNIVIGGTCGIAVSTSGAVSKNTVDNATSGICVLGNVGSSISSNIISNSSAEGILLSSGGATIESNTIYNSPIGIEFNCQTDTVTKNTITGAPIGIDQVPAAFTGVNSFYSVSTVQTGGC